MNKRYFLGLLLCFFTFVFGQNKNNELFDPYVREDFSGQGPEWLKDIQRNPTGQNYFEVEQKFQKWISEDINARLKKRDKKTAVNFYRRWHKAYKPFVNAQGKIVLPTKKEYLRKIDSLNQLKELKKFRRGETTLKKWRNIGPNTTAKNDQYTGFEPSYDSQANVFRLDISKTNNNVLYAGAETGAIFKTEDKGLHWKACDPTFDFGRNITAIKISPKDNNTLWVGSEVGLFLSENGGDSFKRITGIDGRVNSIRVSKDNTNQITVATENGFYVSNNKGQSFIKTLEGICFDHELKPNNQNTVYLLARKQGEYEVRLKISYDGGQNFTKDIQLLKDVNAGRLAVTNAPKGENYLYALVNTFGNYKGVPHIMQSKDAGITWEDKTVRKEDNLYDYKNTFCPSIDAKFGGQGYYDMMLGVSEKNPEHVIYGLCSAYRSLEGGRGNYKVNSIGGYCSGNLKMHPDMQDIAISGDEVWIANDGGIKYSNNFFASKGENRVNGIYTSDYQGFAQGWNEDVMAGGRWHNGDAVIMARYGEGKSVYVGGVEQATGYVMLSNPRKVYFTDGGGHLMPEKIDGKIISDNNMFVSKRPYEVLKSHGFLATDPRYAKRMLFNSSLYNETDQIWETKDEGSTFNFVYKTDGEQISNIAFSRSNPNVIYACGIYDIYVSKDNGKSWSQLPRIPESVGFHYYSQNPTSYIAVDPKDENKLWVAKAFEKGAVAYSKDGGKTWVNPLSDELKNLTFRWIVLAGDELNGVYLGTDEGAKVYYKDDSMSNWVDYSNGLPPALRLTRILPFFKGGKLRAATNQGIWEIPLYREHFKPVAQPMATNIGQAELSNANQEVQFDTYSIVNQDNVQWKWSFSPEPYSVSDRSVSNPKVVFKYNGEYDVTLTVTTPQGSDTKTIKGMIKVTNGEKRPNNPKPQPVPSPEFKVYPTELKSGEDITVEVKNIKGDKIFSIYNDKNVLIKEIRLNSNITKISTKGFIKGEYHYKFTSDNLNKTGIIKVSEENKGQVTPPKEDPQEKPKDEPKKVKKEFKIYPTLLKSGEFLVIEMADLKGEKQFNIYDMKGDLLRKVEIKENKDIEHISTVGLKAGAYIYEFKTPTFQKYGKFLLK